METSAVTQRKRPSRLKKVGRKPVPLKDRHVWTLDEIRARCGAEGDEECWDNYVGMHGQVPRTEHLRRYPLIVQGGVIRVMVRRLAWFLAFGEDPPDGTRLVMSKCSNPRCQNPHHAKPMFEAQKSQFAAAKGHFSSPIKAMRIAAAKQAQGKLNWDKVREIRACTIRHKDEPWKQWDISETMWKRIRAQRAWREASSPMTRMAA